ncbi:MAG TPA: hypothetical protein PLX08_13145 [Bacteroidales bacterium]|jgi:hypothetical protein|nr:hypothetical protein [Bacteroidales bacterium]
MGFKKICNISLLAAILIVQVAVSESFSQGTVSRPSRQAALDAFAKGDYEKACLEFDILLQNYSRDPLYKYYKGVCLVKLNRDPEYAQEYLLDALNGAVDIRSVPNDAWFYLGRSQQMSGRFTEAVKSYNTYENKVGRKVARTMNVSQYIQEAKEGRGKIDGSLARVEDKATEEPVRSILADSVATVKHTVVAENLPVAEKPAKAREEVPDDYDKVLTEAMNYQVKADSITAIATEAKTRLGSMPAGQQLNEKSRIAEMEAQSADYQKLADKKFSDSSNVTSVQSTVPGSSDQQLKPVPKESLSSFKVETNPAVAARQKIAFESALPEGLVYRIQIGVFSKPVEASFFKGISPVSGYSIPGSDAKKYFAGLFRRMSDAGSALLLVRQTGFRDAFINAVMDGKPVSVERASILEKEWGQKPLFNTSPVKKPSGEAVATLVYRVEVSRSPKPVSNDKYENYSAMAGNRGFEVINADDGTFVYLIGKFITFESASEYAGLLNRNGYREAKVAAYLGNREIPLETARQLFENQK